jgi:hypothetical protein
MGLKPHQWKPGQSGNPGGRRKKPLIVEALEEIGAANDSAKARKVAERLYSSALQGSVPAAKLIVEYLHGKPKRAEEAQKEPPKLTREQVDAQLAELLKDQGLRDRLAKLLTPDAKVIQ